MQKLSFSKLIFDYEFNSCTFVSIESGKLKSYSNQNKLSLLNITHRKKALI